VVSRYRSGGLSLAEFARQERIPHGRLHYWVYDKGCREPGGGGPRQASVRLAFQEVRLPAPPLEGVPEWAAEVRLPAGVLVRFSATAAPQWIGAVVQTLQRPC